jgi:hypothetical protein
MAKTRSQVEMIRSASPRVTWRPWLPLFAHVTSMPLSSAVADWKSSNFAAEPVSPSLRNFSAARPRKRSRRSPAFRMSLRIPRRNGTGTARRSAYHSQV